MRDLAISFGRGRKELYWRDGTVSWEDLCEKVKTTVRTYETVEQYHKMSKPEKEAVKNGPAFVLGRLRNHSRKKENVEFRSGLTADVDEAKAGFIGEFKSGHKYAAILYSTHGHTPENPRCRLVIPFARDVTPDEYNAIARHFAAEWGIEQFDPCSFQVNQLMYFPTTPSDGEYVCEILDGPRLDPDEFLAAHPDWRDCSSLPVSSKEKPLHDADGRKQADPLSKEGTVGAFCRTYSIEDAIETFLRDVYEPAASDDRYSYIPGEGTAGLVLYEDKFAYSHHATDPASNRLCNAFDLVRIHKFGEDDEKESFRKMCAFAESDRRVRKTMEKERQEEAQREFEAINENWEPPVPFDEVRLPPFPVEALPEKVRPYVEAVAETTQTPVDMAGSSSIGVMATCMQGKYRVRAKADWTEPVNVFMISVAPPSERKSAVNGHTLKPVSGHEMRYNIEHAAALEKNRMQRRVLEKRQRAVEDKVAKGNADPEEMDAIAKEIADFREMTPMQLYVDDVTPEKLVSILAEHDGIASVISSEGGIFDQLAGGMYSKAVNIDVFLKGHSGDPIRIDRIGRNSESIESPALTMLLTVQPSVLSGLMRNPTFRGRGLTSRFLYTMPESRVGSRKYRTEPIPKEAEQMYSGLIENLLDEDSNPLPGHPEIITLDSEADRMLENFANELEPKLLDEYADFSDWAGKLCGAVVRISGILCRADRDGCCEFMSDAGPLIVDADIMRRAITLGRYYTEHARAAYHLMGADPLVTQCKYLLKAVRESGVAELSRRDAMRLCRGFKNTEELMPVLDRLCEYGYLAQKPAAARTGGGRPPSAVYLVNPAVFNR